MFGSANVREMTPDEYEKLYGHPLPFNDFNFGSICSHQEQEQQREAMHNNDQQRQHAEQYGYCKYIQERYLSNGNNNQWSNQNSFESGNGDDFKRIYGGRVFHGYHEQNEYTEQGPAVTTSPTPMFEYDDSEEENEEEPEERARQYSSTTPDHFSRAVQIDPNNPSHHNLSPMPSSFGEEESSLLPDGVEIVDPRKPSHHAMKYRDTSEGLFPLQDHYNDNTEMFSHVRHATSQSAYPSRTLEDVMAMNKMRSRNRVQRYDEYDAHLNHFLMEKEMRRRNQERKEQEKERRRQEQREDELAEQRRRDEQELRREEQELRREEQELRSERQQYRRREEQQYRRRERQQYRGNEQEYYDHQRGSNADYHDNDNNERRHSSSNCSNTRSPSTADLCELRDSLCETLQVLKQEQLRNQRSNYRNNIPSMKASSTLSKERRKRTTRMTSTLEQKTTADRIKALLSKNNKTTYEHSSEKTDNDALDKLLRRPRKNLDIKTLLKSTARSGRSTRSSLVGVSSLNSLKAKKTVSGDKKTKKEIDQIVENVLQRRNRDTTDGQTKAVLETSSLPEEHFSESLDLD
eukprot:g2478.t1